MSPPLTHPLAWEAILSLRLSTVPPAPQFIVDLWYGSMTPDTEFPAAVRQLVLGMIGPIAARSHKLNLAALLIRDTTEIFTEQLELYRRVVARRAQPAASARAAAAVLASTAPVPLRPAARSPPRHLIPTAPTSPAAARCRCAGGAMPSQQQLCTCRACLASPSQCAAAE